MIKIQGIYAITPNHALDMALIEQIIITYKIFIIQYRHKTRNKTIQLNEAKKLQQICLAHHTLFIINDDVNLCEKLDADGVHLGKNDPSIKYARAVLGGRKIIGVSCYNNIETALSAQQQGADYVAFGALFPSKTKPNTVHCPLAKITQAKQLLSVPIIGIGGINFTNKQLAFNAGCDAVAMIDSLFTRSVLTQN